VELESRLFSFSGNGRAELWEMASRQFAESPLTGGGAGSYEQFWLEHRETLLKVRDAHSLYLEVLAEVGPLGLAALLAALAAPIVAAWRTRRSARTAPVLAVYLAVVVHAGFDWDWEVPAVTVTALAAGAALLLMAGSGRQPTAIARLATGSAAVGLAAFALLGLAASSTLAGAAEAAAGARWEESQRGASRAAALAPWAAAPLQELGRAQLAAGEPDAARHTFERALARAPDDWELWFDLARASDGARRDSALAEATRLNPLSPEIASLRDELRAEAATAYSEVTADEPAP
jgi:hypothetical protein